MSSTTLTPKKLPDPGAVALLGSVMALRVCEPDGRVIQHEWDRAGPGLLWSPSARALYFFPGMEFTKWKELQSEDHVRREGRLDMREVYEVLAQMGVFLPAKATQNAAKLFTTWAARPSTRFTQKLVDPLPLTVQGSGVHILYHSDKWNGRDGKRVDYIHEMPKSGSDKISVAGAGKPPKAFFIKGPRLTVTERGIIW